MPEELEIVDKTMVVASVIATTAPPGSPDMRAITAQEVASWPCAHNPAHFGWTCLIPGTETDYHVREAEEELLEVETGWKMAD